MLQGLAFGTVLGYGAYQTSQNPANFHLTLGAAGVLAGVMGKRWISGGVFMPAGLVAAMSLAMFTRYAIRWIETSNTPSATGSQTGGKMS